MTPCIVDTGKGNEGGYIRRRINGKLIYVHRKAWEDANGPIPEGMSVLHHCDNPPCKNPDHLFLGTQDDNVQDMIMKGRDRKVHGEEQWCAKLTETQVIEIRRLWATGRYSQSGKNGLARMFGVSATTIRRVVTEIRWRHLL